MDQYTIKDFGKIVKKNTQTQRHELLANGTNVFRVYDRNQEDFPVTVDIYANYARVQVYSEEDLSDEVKEIITDQINRMAYIDRDKIIFSYKAKREKGQQHEKSENEALIVEVKENNLLFKVDLTTYTDTGLFLDHINTRALISQQSAGLNILNLFSYTGSFSVYAAAGRAKKVTSVDLSATYTRWAEENLKANGYEGENYPCVCCDATKFVEEAIKSNERYDIIIFDPPSFSNSHKMEKDFDVQKDFYDWIRNLRLILTKNGLIMFSTNLGSFKIDKRRLRGFNVKEMTTQLWAEGFVKGRKGTTRSWLMALDDNSLTLDWSEDKVERKPRKERSERSSKGSYEHRERRDFHGRDDHRDRDRRDFRERRDDRSHRSDRDFERPRYEHRDRDDRPRRYDDRRREDRFDRDRKPRYEHSDYDTRHRYSERTSERRFEERPRYEKPRYEKARYNDRNDRNDRPRREPRDKKPYGYDSFRPARSREESPDFFWNEEN